MTWALLVDGWRAAERARGMSPDTIRTRSSWLRMFAAVHPPAADMRMIEAWLANESWTPATRKSARGALVSFYRWAHRAGHLEQDPTDGLPPVRVPRTLPRPASEQQVHAGLAATCPNVRLMVHLAAEMGLRRSEIARVRREDLDAFGLHVRGKGGKDRIVPPPPWIRRDLESRPSGWIFPGRFTGHVHPSTVQRWIRESAGVAPHAHRHRFATQAYRNTSNLFGVQRALGHASAETTQVYVEVAAMDVAAVVLAAAA